MIYKVFSVKDLKAAAFAPPFFLHREEVALRTFRDAVADPSHPMHAHPEDYELYVVGTFDDETGILSAVDTPVFLVRGMNQEQSNG